MQNKPLFLLTFANQQDDYLNQLKEESKLINNLLAPYHDKGSIEIYREESTTISDLSEAISRFADRITVFHYAGHANGSSLHFEDTAGDAQGLAELLGQLPNLKLVFLNGCSTLPQVEALLKNGVKAIIATAVPINDNKAVEFAENFYRFLSNNNTIEEAFRRSVAIMRTRYGGSFDATIIQKGQQVDFTDTVKMPWGLFLNTDGADALQWRIPLKYTPSSTRETVSDYVVNNYLLDVIEGMIDHKPEIESMVYGLDNNLDERAALLQIIQNFPWPIGTQIRLLATNDEGMNKASVTRIKQLISVYFTLSQFLLYTALSQFWDEKRANSFDSKSTLNDILYLNKQQFKEFDFFRNFIHIAKLLKASDCPLFIKEIEPIIELFDQKSDLYNAYNYLESLRMDLNEENLLQLEAHKYQKCADAEYHLTTLLYTFAFLVKYDLVTIRDIHVINHRHLDSSFNHFMRRLNVKVGNLSVTDPSQQLRAKSYNSFTNNASVVLTADLHNPQAFLNLSPFIIDKNAFGHGMTEDRATEQQLYIYAHRSGAENNDYTYYATIHSIFTAVDRPMDQFSVLKQQMNHSEPAETSRRRVRRRRSNENTPVEDNPFKVLRQQFEVFENDIIA